ncbi:MAG: hypothetical protein Kow0047_03730 [Anaerolineae bacterium]
MADLNDAHISLIRTFARWPVSGRRLLLIRFDPVDTEAGLRPEAQGSSAGLHDRVHALERRMEQLAASQEVLRTQIDNLMAAFRARESEEREGSAASDEPLADQPMPMLTTGDSLESSEIVDSWITVREAAEYLGLSQSTVRRYIRQGLLPAARLPSGRGVRILRSEVERLLDFPSRGSNGDEQGPR